MIEKLETNKSCKVLEIGTGSGYLTAILSKLSKRVFSIERHEILKKKAESLLINNNFRNVIFKIKKSFITILPRILVKFSV